MKTVPITYLAFQHVLDVLKKGRNQSTFRESVTDYEKKNGETLNTKIDMFLGKLARTDRGQAIQELTEDPVLHSLFTIAYECNYEKEDRDNRPDKALDVVVTGRSSLPPNLEIQALISKEKEWREQFNTIFQLSVIDQIAHYLETSQSALKIAQSWLELGNSDKSDTWFTLAADQVTIARICWKRAYDAAETREESEPLGAIESQIIIIAEKLYEHYWKAFEKPLTPSALLRSKHRPFTAPPVMLKIPLTAPDNAWLSLKAEIQNKALQIRALVTERDALLAKGETWKLLETVERIFKEIQKVRDHVSCVLPWLEGEEKKQAEDMREQFARSYQRFMDEQVEFAGLADAEVQLTNFMHDVSQKSNTEIIDEVAQSMLEIAEESIRLAEQWVRLGSQEPAKRWFQTAETNLGQAKYYCNIGLAVLPTADEKANLELILKKGTESEQRLTSLRHALFQRASAEETVRHPPALPQISHRNGIATDFRHEPGAMPADVEHWVTGGKILFGTSENGPKITKASGNTAIHGINPLSHATLRYGQASPLTVHSPAQPEEISAPVSRNLALKSSEQSRSARSPSIFLYRLRRKSASRRRTTVTCNRRFSASRRTHRAIRSRHLAATLARRAMRFR